MHNNLLEGCSHLTHPLGCGKYPDLTSWVMLVLCYVVVMLKPSPSNLSHCLFWFFLAVQFSQECHPCYFIFSKCISCTLYSLISPPTYSNLLDSTCSRVLVLSRPFTIVLTSPASPIPFRSFIPRYRPCKVHKLTYRANAQPTLVQRAFSPNFLFEWSLLSLQAPAC